jgi:protein TonB
MTLVALAHAGAWYGLSQLRDDIVPPRPLKVIEVALLTPPEPPKIAEKPPEPPKPEPPKPEPRPKVQPREKPEPRRLLAPQAVAEREMEQPAEAPPPVPAPTPPAAVAEPPKAAPEPVVEAPRFNAAYLNNPPPAYPLAARRRGMEGRVLVRAEVQADGSCNRVELKKTSGHDLLDQAALEAVKKWRFVPARKGGQAVAAWVEVPITFNLEN